MLIGKELKNDLLYWSSFGMILILFAFTIYNLLSPASYFSSEPKDLYSEEDIFIITIGLIILIINVIISIFFGLGLLNLKNKFGNIAVVAGILQIISGAFLLSIIFVSLIITIPLMILEIFILFRASKKL